MYYQDENEITGIFQEKDFWPLPLKRYLGIGLILLRVVETFLKSYVCY